MKNVTIELLDKKISIQAKEVTHNIFTAKYEVALEKLALDTFWKRIKWLITGKI